MRCSSICFLQTGSNGCCQFGVLGLEIVDSSSSPWAHSSGCSSPNDRAGDETIANNLSGFDNKAVGIILILYGIDKSLGLVDLFFRAISKTDHIDCNCIFLEFFCQYFKGLDIFLDGGADEAYHSGLLSLIGTVFEGKCSYLYGLHGWMFTCAKCSSPLDLTPKR